MASLVDSKRSTSRAFALGTAAALTFFTSVAAAQGTAAAPQPEAIVVVVRSDADALSADEVRAAIARELGVATISPEEAAKRPGGVRGAVTVTWRPSRGELAVTYEDAAHGVLTRVVPAPADRAGAVVSASMLAGNLARNEAAGLLPAKPKAPPPAPTPPPKPAVPSRRVPASAAFFYPLATNFGDPEVTTYFDFNLLHGRVGRVEGAQIGTVNLVGQSQLGVQIGALTSIVGGDADGLQIAGGANVVGGHLTGLAIALGADIVRGDLSGMSAALGLGLAGGEVRGAQIAGVAIAGKRVTGAQIGGVAVAGEHVTGAQIGGVAIATEGVDGLQVSGVNVAGDVRGVQIGAVNIAKRVTGVQIGLVNVLDDGDAVPLGLVSVSRTGGVHPVVWGSNTTFGNIGIKLATRYTYTVFHASAHYEDRTAFYGGGLLLGARVPLQKFFFDADVGGTYLVNGRTCCVGRALAPSGDTILGKLRVLAGYSFFPHLGLFVGGGITVRARIPEVHDVMVPVTLVPEILGGIEL
ncbi:Hypothetical protein A7982_01945 [Minicystis rosea]|nr:Hypothetical protein A7982_01945 [Minicystis rosea]